MCKLVLIAFVLLSLIPLARAADPGPALLGEPAPHWWQRGQTSWYYKDDWHGPFLMGGEGCQTTFTLPGNAEIEQAGVHFWSSGHYTLDVNGQRIGEDWDSGTIEDYVLTDVLRPGENTLSAEIGGSEFNAEIHIRLADGREFIIPAEASWSPGAQPSDERRRGPRGYGGNCHMARPMEITAEQRAKNAVNRINAVRRRLLTHDQYINWRRRDPVEVLSPAEATDFRQDWAAAMEHLANAEPYARQAHELILAGEYDRALQAASAEEVESFIASANRFAEAGSISGPTQPNQSDYNPLGWVASCEPLDNDPAYWEFDIAPAQARSIALAGLWRFRVDANNRGVESGYHSDRIDADDWQTIYAPSKWGWERHGVTQHNTGFGANKPYNGFAWYRKTIDIPAEWAGEDLLLGLGPRWGNRDWLAVNGQWVNPPDSDGSGEDTITIPAAMIRPGQANTFALRVRNQDNIGGIINPGLRLSVADDEPTVRRHIVGCGSARQMIVADGDGAIEQIAYSSALTPGVIVATSGTNIRIGSWQARGYDAPAQIRTNLAPASAESFATGPVAGAPAELEWLHLRPADGGDTRPLVIALLSTPSEVEIVDDGFGGLALELTFDEPGPRIGLVRPDAAPDGQAPAEYWTQLLRRPPIRYYEQLRYDGDRTDVTLRYEYADFSRGLPSRPVAPLPMLFSYAIEHDWPDAQAPAEAIDLGGRARGGFYPGSDCGTYRVVEGADAVSYSFDRMEPHVHFKGYGTLGEENRLGERMYSNMAAWGANCYRPQLRGSDVPNFDDPDSIARFDQRIRMSRQYGMTCVINYFTGQGLNPQQRREFIELWRNIAEHCKDLPADAVIYNLINEPAHFGWDDYNAFVAEVTHAIREIDQTHWISVEFGGGWAQPEDADMTEPTGDERTIYQFHFYGPHSFESYIQSLWYPRYEWPEERFRSYEGWEERMLSPIRFRIRHHAELMHGEFGITFLGPDESPHRWLRDVLAIHEKYRMGWNWWNYSGSGISRTGLVAGERINPLVPILTRFAQMPRPSEPRP